MVPRFVREQVFLEFFQNFLGEFPAVLWMSPNLSAIGDSVAAIAPYTDTVRYSVTVE